MAELSTLGEILLKKIEQDKEFEELIYNILNFIHKLKQNYAEKELKNYKTYELSRELEKRETIQSIFIEPYGKATIIVEPENPDKDNIVLNIEGCASIMIDRS